MKRTMKPVFLEIIMVLLLWIPASSSGGSGQTDGLDIILKKAAVYCEKLKVALDQNAVQGFEELKKKAEAMGETLSVSDTHWYAVEKGGLCFPSRTEINEVYSFDGRFLRVTGQVSLVKTIFSYSRYRFFSISTQVTEDVGSEQSSPPVK